MAYLLSNSGFSDILRHTSFTPRPQKKETTNLSEEFHIHNLKKNWLKYNKSETSNNNHIHGASSNCSSHSGTVPREIDL